MPWINSDGLPVLYGVEEAADRAIGEFGNLDGLRWVEVRLKASELPTVAENAVVYQRTYRLPREAVIYQVELGKPTTAWAGTGVLSIGIVDEDETTNLDTDFFVVAATVAELNAGGRAGPGTATTLGWEGASTNTTPQVPFASQKKITVEVDTAAITAGESTLYIYWTVPNIQDDTLVYDKDA